MSGNAQPMLMHQIISGRQSHYCYALIEPFDIAGFDEQWSVLSTAPGAQWRSLPIASLASAPGLQPLLLRLSDGTPCETLMLWLLQQPGADQRCILFTTWFDWQQVIAFWLQRTEALYPQGMVAPFNSFSAPILSLLWQTLGDEQQQSFVAGLEGLYLPEGAAWRLLAIGNQVAEPAFEQIQLSEQQYELLTRESRRELQSQQLFLRLQPYHRREFSPADVRAVYFDTLQRVQQQFADADARSCEIMAQRRFVWGKDYFIHPVFLALCTDGDYRKALRRFQQKVCNDAALGRDMDFHDWLPPLEQ